MASPIRHALRKPARDAPRRWLGVGRHELTANLPCYSVAARIPNALAHYPFIKGSPHHDLVALLHLRTVALLLGELEGWLEEVHELTRCSVQLGRCMGRLQSLEATIADQTAYHRSVFLFHPRLIGLKVRVGSA